MNFPVKKYAGLVSKTILFADLPDSHIRKLMGIAVVKDIQKQAQIFSEGDDANGFYINVDALIKVYKLSAEGKEQILHVFGPGEPFGEVPVFSGKTFPAHAEAIAAGRVLFFPRQAFVELITKHPSLALNMLAVLSMRLRQFTVQIENLTLKEVPGRLAAYLLMRDVEQDGKGVVSLTISKAQLSSFLGTIPETLSRMLTRMAGQGLIDVQGREIRLKDIDGLRELAESGRLRDSGDK